MLSERREMNSKRENGLKSIRNQECIKGHFLPFSCRKEGKRKERSTKMIVQVFRRRTITLSHDLLNNIII